MARTMRWPPVPHNGRIAMVEGTNATAVLIINVLSDLTQNPFNPDNLSLGEVTFRSKIGAEARMKAALGRLSSVVIIDEVREVSTPEDTDEGYRSYTIVFTDRESRQRSEVNVNG